MDKDIYEISECLIGKMLDELRELRKLGLIKSSAEAKEVINYAAGWVNDWIEDGEFDNDLLT